MNKDNKHNDTVDQENKINSEYEKSEELDNEDTNQEIINDNNDDDNANKQEDTLDSLNEKISELNDQYIRIVAENENLRKRTDREILTAKKYASFNLVKDLLTSLDNIEKAVESIPKNKEKLDENLKNVFLGMEMTHSGIMSTLEKFGVEEINPVGENFDYNFHQAMFEVETENEESGKIVEVVQKGFLLYDRLLRPAMVGVSKSINDKKN